ncbi:MAG: PEGA domain-containing protein [Terriglobales bacterium]
MLVCCLAAASYGKDEPVTIEWPQDKPAIKFTFGKFQRVGSLAGQNTYVCDVVVENLTDKTVPRASFTVYGNDKNNVRIGEGFLVVSDLNPQQQAKVRLQFNSVGVPARLMISAKKDTLASPDAKTIPLRVLSVPPGAKLKVDGQEAGVTPVMVRLAVGSHTLDLTKEGYMPGNTPLEVTPDELPGGSITIELGGLSRDTVELRDGTVILGDVLSMSMTLVVVSIDGREQNVDRNQVKKVMLVERQVTQQPVVIQAPLQSSPTKH